jgi:hypothetical protein
MPLPGQVDEFSIRADGDDLCADFLETIILLCQSSKFSRSDKREVGRIKEEDGPFFVILQLIEADFAEVLRNWIIDLNLK